MSVFETPGFWWLVLTISVSGIVRGFSGFGTGMIFIPVAGQFLKPSDVVLLSALLGVASTLPLLPNAWRIGERKDVGVLVLAACVTVPIGVWVLTQADTLVLRWVVSIVIFVALVTLVSGWRHSGALGITGRLSVGGTAGFLGGLVGLTGPVIVVFNLSSPSGIATVRANTILFLVALDLAVTVNIFRTGADMGQMLWLGGVLLIPYTVTILLGQSLFNPARERLYRVAAYSVIGVAVLTSLPIFD